MIDNARRAEASWNGQACGRRAVPLSPQRSESPQRDARGARARGAARPASRVGFAIAGSWPALAAAARLRRRAAPPAAPAPGRASHGAAAGSGAGAAAGAGRRRAAQPDALRVPGAVAEGAGLRQPCRTTAARCWPAAWPTPPAWCCPSSALAALLLALRAGGEQLGWGFQLQSPAVIAVLAALFTLIGLNLAGRVRVRLGAAERPGAAARAPPAGRFGCSPACSRSPWPRPAPRRSWAPRSALAATLPAAQALAIFARAGPGHGAALPRRQRVAGAGARAAAARARGWRASSALMAFPMFATVVWLVWVLGQQVGIDGAAALLAHAAWRWPSSAWALGSPGSGRARAPASACCRRGAAGRGAAWMGRAFAAQRRLAAPHWRRRERTGSPGRPSAWPRRAAAGQPVFVDFTAAWCVTCQFNKRTTLADAEVMADFDARGVLLLRADWTRRDAAITAELARLGRNGVPVYALYGADPAPAAAAADRDPQRARGARRTGPALNAAQLAKFTGSPGTSTSSASTQPAIGCAISSAAGRFSREVVM